MNVVQAFVLPKTSIFLHQVAMSPCKEYVECLPLIQSSLSAAMTGQFSELAEVGARGSRSVSVQLNQQQKHLYR